MLCDEVKEAVKRTYVRLKKGKEAFERVEIDDAPIASTGVFHVKIRHLDAFLQYELKTGQTDKTKLFEAYALGKELDLTKTLEYCNLWKNLVDKMNKIEDYYQGTISQLKAYCGAGTVKKRRSIMTDLLKKSPDNKYIEDIVEFGKAFESFVGFEEKSPLTRIINDTVSKILIEILENPFEVFYDLGNGDFVFCSDKYCPELALVLKTNKSGGPNAVLFTSYSKKREKIDEASRGYWKRVYKRKGAK